MFRQVSRIVIKANATTKATRSVTSTAAKKSAALAAHAHPESYAFKETPSDMAVVAAGAVVIGFFGLQFWNCTATASRIGKEDFQFKAFEQSVTK